MVERLFLAVPWGCLRFVIVVFPDHTHFLFLSRLLTSSTLYGPQDVETYSIAGWAMELYVVSRTCLLQSLKLRLRNPRVPEALAAVAWVCYVKVVADGRTNVFGAVCDLKALTMEEIVSFSTVTLACCDYQHGCTSLRGNSSATWIPSPPEPLGLLII